MKLATIFNLNNLRKINFTLIYESYIPVQQTIIKSMIRFDHFVWFTIDYSRCVLSIHYLLYSTQLIGYLYTIL